MKNQAWISGAGLQCNNGITLIEYENKLGRSMWLNNANKRFWDSLHTITQMPINQFPKLNACGQPQNSLAKRLIRRRTLVVYYKAQFFVSIMCYQCFIKFKCIYVYEASITYLHTLFYRTMYIAESGATVAKQHLLTYFLCLSREIMMLIRLPCCPCVPFQFLNQLTDFHKTLHECYATKDHLNAVLFISYYQ
jgi:hypothetical protein